MYYGNQVDYSASSESAFIKNFSPANPPPIQIALQLHPELTSRYGFMVGLAAQEIETKRKLSPPRMYFFNKMARDGFLNNDFKELIVSCIKTAAYLYFGQKQTDWNYIVTNAVESTLNMVLASITLQSAGLRLQYQVPAQHISELENIYNTFIQIDNQANIIIESVQRQAQGISTYGNSNSNIHNVHSGVMGGSNMQGGMNSMMNSQEPTINIPGLGTMSLSEYNALKGRLNTNQAMMGGQAQQPNMPNSSINSSNIASLISGMGSGPTIGADSIPESVRRTLVPDSGTGVINSVQNQVDNGIAQSLGLINEGHETETSFSPKVTIAGTPAPTATPSRQPIIQATTSSIAGVTEIKDGKEYFKGKPVYRVEGYHETFFIDFDGSIPIKPSEHFIAIPACINATHKRVYQIYNDGTFRSVDLFDLTDEEKLDYRKSIDMDIKRHEILMSEEQANARMGRIAATLNKPPASVVRTTVEVEVPSPVTTVEQGEDKQLIDVEHIDKIIAEREKVEVPNFAHVVQDALSDVGDLDTISEKYLLEYTVDQQNKTPPDVFTIVANQYQSLFDPTQEGLINAFIKQLQNSPTLKAVGELFEGAFKDAQRDEDTHLIRSLTRLEKIYVEAINQRLGGQMGLEVRISDWRGCYDELLAGLDKYFGILTAQTFLRDERNFVRSILTSINKDTLTQLYGNLKKKEGEPVYTEKELVFVAQKVTYTTIPATEKDLQLDFTHNKAGVVSLDPACHVVLHALAKRVLTDTTGTGRQALTNYIVTSDNVTFKVSEGLFDVNTVNIQKVS